MDKASASFAYEDTEDERTYEFDRNVSISSWLVLIRTGGKDFKGYSPL